MSSRRVVQRIEPYRQESFDQQFWPVVVAMCVLCGIAFGTALTLLRGPWVWGSLLLIVIGATGAIALLYRLDNTKLRRSLQLSIIVSLAAHLLALVVASFIGIFSNSYHFVRPNSDVTPNRVVEINNHRTPFVFEQTRTNETVDPEVEVQREQTTSQTQPQPVPVQSTDQPVNPQLVRREQPATTVARMDRDLSQRRRQERSLELTSTVEAAAQPAARPQPDTPREAEPGQQVAIARAASESVTDRSASQTQPDSEQSPVQSDQSTIAERAQSARPETAAPNDQPAMQSQAPRRSRSPQIAISEPMKQLAEPVTPPRNTEADASPSRSVEELTRRPSPSQITRPSEVEQPTTQVTPNSQVARASQRETRQSQPTISRENSEVPEPRRASVNVPTPTTTANVEAPSRAPQSTSQTTQMNARTLSIERGSTGVAGGGNASNLERELGGIQSPAVQASDSSMRRRTESRPTNEPLLVSTQQSEVRRSVSQQLRPRSAFEVNTTEPSPITGSTNPTSESIESSAASVNSSTADHRSEISVERGQSTADIGTTKIVDGETSRRRSGGGQPDVTELNPESTRRSNVESSQRRPTLNATVDAITGAESTPTATPQSAATAQPDATPVAYNRSGGPAEVTFERSMATESGAESTQGDSELLEELANSRQRAESGARTDSGQFNSDNIDQQQGNTDTRFNRAPLVRGTERIGNTEFNGGSSDSSEQTAGEAPASTVVERSNGSSAGATSRVSESELAGGSSDRSDSTGTGAAGLERRRNTNDTGSSDSEIGEAMTSTAPSSDRSPSVNPVSVESFVSGETNGSASEMVEATELAVDRSAARSEVQGAALEIDAEEGAAGLGDIESTNLGIRDRPANRESENISPDNDTRFRTDRFGGNLAVSPDAVLAREAFMERNPGQPGAGEPTNERAIQIGLEWLVKQQSPDGSWSLTGYDTDHPNYSNQIDSDTAATGLALLAFQGAGYSHREFKYARQMDMAIQWLVENQAENGGLYIETDERSNKSCRLYSHGIAALALSEAYGMTQDPQLREPAQRALNFIIQTQDPDHGGWRYYTQMDARQTDTSVTGWMMMALKSGQLAGLDVDEGVMDRIAEWLDVAADPDYEGQFRYNPLAADTAVASREQGRRSSPAMTSVGLLMRMYMGWNRDDERLSAGAQSLLDAQMPSDATIRERDTYYWYYATQVLLHVGGDKWEQWHQSLHPLLVDSQIQEGELAGSWHPYEPVPDRWGIHAGRLYVTTMNILSLEVRNRKLPLYDDTAK